GYGDESKKYQLTKRWLPIQLILMHTGITNFSGGDTAFISLMSYVKTFELKQWELVELAP
ncbi:hypothetical protein P4V33_25480, partial [Brevibacillus borstelensis]|uniref:hypothetical protein n=1 Tax=Brevibacillus borstelensis TaxID=45462 RepID=UPI002E1B0A7A|nr:hypothetical protein [Brevibacillus borstelensis]